MRPLTATARLQFHRGFTLHDATALVPYFDRLGISHLYASPLLTARAGSTHGYDIVDHNRINPELGGEDALRTLVEALRTRGMGLVLDIVPNHMGVGGADNAWWLDVLEWGRASPYAVYFDIDWDPPDATQRGRVLAPFLGEPYGQVLASGQLTLQFDAKDGRLSAMYGEHRFPIQPRDYAAVLLTEGGTLEEPARLFAEIGQGGRASVHVEASAARAALREPQHASAIAAMLEAYSPKTELGRDRLHRLLERQSYRLAWWRAATDEINWRRFFDVNGLAGIRQEVPEVFEATHRTVFRLYAEGLIDGVRIDHVDGLAYPRDYCRKLRRRLDAITTTRPDDLRDPAIIWIEKILAPNERLAADWQTDGTTGYDAMNTLGALLHDPDGEAPLTTLWHDLTGRPAVFEDEAMPARRQVLAESLASELYQTATALHRVARRDLSTRDFTHSAIRAVLIEILVHFHVYRIYAGLAGISEIDKRVMDRAVAGARRTVRSADRLLLDHVTGWLSGTDVSGGRARDVPAGPRRQEWARAMVKFQQLSAPTAAKSIEDTTFYRYGRLLSRNEVGSEPSQWSLSPAAFHADCAQRAKHTPRALLATATHDHKRGEDTRARLAVLSEAPAEWEAALNRWMRLNAPLRRDLGGPAPDRADEIMLYQTLVGAWPAGLTPDEADAMRDYEHRVAGWVEKALREAKRHTGWAAPDEAYEGAARAFLGGVLDPTRPVAAELAEFANRIGPAGAINSLTQMVLRLTMPGVPDLYQGTEFWDFSLVDPDNRRPVDFAKRDAALGVAPADAMAHWTDGRVKQAILARLLALRAAQPGLFTVGSYTPLKVDGPAADHIVAFTRLSGEQTVIIAATRLPYGLCRNSGPIDRPLPPSSAWAGSTVLVPRNLGGRRCDDVLTGRVGVNVLDEIAAASLFKDLPVAVLHVS